MVGSFNSPEFTGTVSNVTLTPRTQEDYFNFEFSGYLDILTEGDYIFRLTSDDGSRLFFDNATVVDNDGQHGNITVFSDTLHLATGPHPLKLQYFEYSGGQNLTLQWKGPVLSASYKSIPDSLFRSGRYVPPVPPSIPQHLSASGVGMGRIDLTWQTTSGGEVELYRSASATGTFSIIGRSATAVFVDSTGLVPGTAYYYQARTVSATGLSGFTTIVSASTTEDTEAPSVPTGLQLSNNTHTHVALTWSPSTDNAEVSGYEIFTNGVLAGTSEIPAFMVTGLLPNTPYNFTVKAKDASGNLSPASAVLIVTTNPSAIYYSLSAGNLNEVNTWKQNANGTGNSPASFSVSGQYFIISNRTQTGLGGAWDVAGSASKVIVPTGVTLTVDFPFSGKLELEGTATVNLNHTEVPELQKISATSTVNFNAHSFIPKKTYGHLILSGTGIKTFEADATIVSGNLSVAHGITLKGSAGNTTTLTLNGNLTVNGVAGIPAADNRIDLRFTEGVSHTITSGGDLFFYSLSGGTNAVINVAATVAPVKLTTGSLNGGGLKLENGSTLAIGNGSIHVGLAGTLNPGNESGRISINGGSVKVTSTSNLHSNLYFDPAGNVLDSLSINLTGTGAAIVRSEVKISTGLKIKRGILNGGGFVTLLSTSAKTASLAEIENGGSVSGAIKVQHYLEPLGESWRDLSTPVNGVKVADWQNYFPITGSFIGSSDGGTEPSMFISNGASMIGYPAAGGTNQAPLERGKGYQTKMNEVNPVTIQVSGSPFQGIVPFSLQGGSGGGTSTGWNLLGNPYASPVAWSSNPESWTRSGISATIAVRKNKLVNGQPVTQYIYYNPLLGDGIIPAGQAFWAQAVNSSPVLSITEKAKTTQAVAYPQPDPSLSYLVVSLQQGSLTDDAYIVFVPEATDDFDDLMDGLKRPNEGMFNLSTVIGDISVSVNHLSNSFCSKSVNLNVQNVSTGTYALLFTGVQSLAGLGQVSLTDHYTGTSVPVTGSAYSFSVTSDPATYGPNRFTLSVLRYQLNTTAPQVTAADVCWGDFAAVTIEQAQAGVEYTVVNANHQPISDIAQATQPDLILQVPVTALQEGINHLQVRAGFPGCTTQLLTSADDLVLTSSFAISTAGDISVCHGDRVMLQASGVPEGGHYRWLDENGVTIDSVTDGTFLTAPVMEETTMKVGGVLSSGCESELKTIHIYADTLEFPVITLYNDTLFVQVQADYQWTKNGTVIEGENKPYYVPSGSGTFGVIVSRMGCSKQSVPYEYVIDPGCQINLTAPVASVADNCGDEVVFLTISNTQVGVVYRAINIDQEIISLAQTGTGGSVVLEISATELDPGINKIRVKADLEGCVDRVLNSEATFTYNPPIPKPQIVVEDHTLVVSATGSYQWKRDGEIIEGATSSSFAPQAGGEYSVVVTQGICSVESDGMDFTVTGLSEVVSELVLHAYPVPARGDRLKIRVQSPRPGAVFVQLIDITGRDVFNKWYSPEELDAGVPVSPESGPLTNGIYCVIAIQGQTELRRRIVVKN
jgi:hypothetical protein